MKVTCVINTYPDETSVKGEEVTIRNHWNMTDRVVIKIGNKEFVLLTDDLKRAIENCANHRSY